MFIVNVHQLEGVQCIGMSCDTSQFLYTVVSHVRVSCSDYQLLVIVTC